MEKLLSSVVSDGVYSSKTDQEAGVIYPYIFKDDVFPDFSELIGKLDIMKKVQSNPNPLKVKILQRNHTLEEEINRFVLGKQVISIQLNGSTALVVYK